MKMQNVLLMTILVSLCLAVPASASVLFSDDFEDGNLDEYSTSGSVRICTAPNGNTYLECPGTGSGVSRTFDTSGMTSADSWDVVYDLGWDDGSNRSSLLSKVTLTGIATLQIRQGDVGYKWTLLDSDNTFLAETGGMAEDGSPLNDPEWFKRKMSWDAETNTLQASLWDASTSTWVEKLSVTGVSAPMDATQTEIVLEMVSSKTWVSAAFDNVTVVPEPATLSVLALGAIGGMIRRRK